MCSHHSILQFNWKSVFLLNIILFKKSSLNVDRYLNIELQQYFNIINIAVQLCFNVSCKFNTFKLSFVIKLENFFNNYFLIVRRFSFILLIIRSNISIPEDFWLKMCLINSQLYLHFVKKSRIMNTCFLSSLRMH